jgi:hypothetical protein
MRIKASIANPPLARVDWHARWEGSDRGLITCWLRGIEKSRESPELSERAKRGELPVLAWKGGVKAAIKSTTKIGAFNYLATWQGLRGEDLDIDLDSEITITCSVHKVPVTFTNNIAKLLLAAEDAESE